MIHRALLETAPTCVPDTDCINLWLGPGFHVVHYAAGPKATFNIVISASSERELVQIRGRCSTTLSDVLGSVSHWLPWPALTVQPLESWHRPGLLLLGDAAHGTVPYLAQGAAMALEDAAHLQTLLQLGLTAVQDPGNWIDRMKRTRAIQRASLRNGHTYHLTGAAAIARNAALQLMPPTFFLRSIAWIYDGN
jgi:salicylate hydroxylase